MVREFYIENELGQRFSMMDIEKGCFLNSPSGLGYGYDTQYSQIGDNFLQNIRKIKQSQISGEMIFKTYDNYKKVVDFVESSEDLKFVYKVPYKEGFKEFFKDIDIYDVEKTEISTEGVLKVGIMFSCKSLWYEKNEITYNMSSSNKEIRWDFEWDSIFADYSNRSIIFDNKGHTEAPFKLELNGEVMNPVITILENDVEVKKLDLTGLTIEAGETFIYNTKDTEQQIILKSQEETRNLFDFLNPNFINFYKLRKGVSTIRLGAENEITNGKLTIYVQYKAV